MKEFLNNFLRILKQVTKYICYAILLLLIVLAVYTFVVTDVLKKDYVNVFGYTYFQTASGSMSGTIEINDIIIVKITKDVKTNDIISYINEDNDIITHRLIKKSGNQLIAKGDANGTEDEPITKKQVLGKVTHKFLILSILGRIITNRLLLLLGIMLPMAFLVAIEIIKLVYRKDDDEYDKLLDVENDNEDEEKIKKVEKPKKEKKQKEEKFEDEEKIDNEMIQIVEESFEVKE